MYAVLKGGHKISIDFARANDGSPASQLNLSSSSYSSSGSLYWNPFAWVSGEIGTQDSGNYTHTFTISGGQQLGLVNRGYRSGYGQNVFTINWASFNGVQYPVTLVDALP